MRKLIALALFVLPVSGATVTAVSGGGTWGTGATWDTGVVPTAADDCVLALTSGAVTISADVHCRSINASAYTHTLTHTANYYLYLGDATPGAGNVALAFGPGMTYTHDANNSYINFISTSATQQTIDFGGSSPKLISRTTFNGAGGSWLLNSNFTSSSCAGCDSIILTAGTLTVAPGKTLTLTGDFTGTGTASRSLVLNDAVINLTSNYNYGAWNFKDTTNLTFNAGTSVITLNPTSVAFASGSTGGNTPLTYARVIVNRGSGYHAMAWNTKAGTTFGNLSFLKGTDTAADTVTLSSDITVTGALTVTGYSGTYKMTLNSSVGGTNRTITAGSSALTNYILTDVTINTATSSLRVSRRVIN